MCWVQRVEKEWLYSTANLLGGFFTKPLTDSLQSDSLIFTKHLQDFEINIFIREYIYIYILYKVFINLFFVWKENTFESTVQQSLVSAVCWCQGDHLVYLIPVGRRRIPLRPLRLPDCGADHPPQVQVPGEGAQAARLWYCPRAAQLSRLRWREQSRGFESKYNLFLWTRYFWLCPDPNYFDEFEFLHFTTNCCKFWIKTTF